MRYVVPKFDCFLFKTESIELCANVQYCLENVDNSNYFIFGKNQELPYIVNFLNIENNENVTRVKMDKDEYYFLHPKKFATGNFVDFKFLNNHVCVSLLNGLYVSCNGEVLLDEKVYDINYSHFEIVGELCIIHFIGVRNYIVILKGTELCCAGFYDEYNKENEEQYFMCRLHDSLNHGRVFHIKDKMFDSYLVYLDDNDLKLKSEFVGNVFLDCIKSKNFKYSNEMLIEDLKQDDENNIEKFFIDFDDFFAVDNRIFVTFKKNTLAGIYKFEYLENKISNIIQLE